MSEDLTERAFAAFPALRRLAALLDRGWQFFPKLANDGELVVGVCAWPPETGAAAAIRVRTETEVSALRTDRDGGIVWQHEGGLVEVVDTLLVLPAPDHRLAPRLVRAGTAPKLWVPR